MYKPWHYLSVLVGVILVVAAPAWADYQAGVEAFTRGDYNTALRVFHPLAEGGHAEAQAMLGNIYTPGLGVPHDNHQAAKWYRLAAEQGLARAQLNLGLMYSKGQGVSKDNVLAHMWLTLAGAQGNAYARRAQNAVEKLMGNRNDKRPFCLDRNVPKNSPCALLIYRIRSDMVCLSSQ
ncbi:MAG: tetratricopeptide repeat protein [Nitrospirales bacterium]